MTGSAPSTSPPSSRGPLLTQDVILAMRAALDGGAAHWSGSLDLGRSEDHIVLGPARWFWRGRDYPWPQTLRERTIYAWDGSGFVVVQRYRTALVKLVPTPWGAPTFEIDGVKMLPTAAVSPWIDAQRKVALVAPAGKWILDTCGGLGYFARAACDAAAAHVTSFETSPDVVWLRSLNPWSPDPADSELATRLRLVQGDVTEHIAHLPNASFDAVLHDPPRFGIAGELYAQVFYDELARVLRPLGRLFHYTGTPNQRSHGRDLPGEVMRRLERAGFRAERALDGVLATRAASPRPR